MSLVETVLGGLGAGAMYNKLDNLNTDVQNKIGQMETTLPEYAKFKPYTVTSGLANVTADPTGGYNLDLSGQQQELQNQMFGGAQGMFNQVTGSTADREQEMYDRIRALQSPQEQEARLALENRMAAQGRLGLQSNQYGGSTPELMAQERALNEARNQAALSAIGAAGQEQQRLANIGSSMFNLGYAPTKTALAMMTPAIQGSQIATQAGSNVADILGQVGLGGLTQQANLGKTQAQLIGDLATTLGGAFGGTQAADSVDNWASGLLGSIFGSSEENPVANLLSSNGYNFLSDNFLNPSTGENTWTGSTTDNVMAYLNNSSRFDPLEMGSNYWDNQLRNTTMGSQFQTLTGGN